MLCCNAKDTAEGVSLVTHTHEFFDVFMSVLYLSLSCPQAALRNITHTVEFEPPLGTT